MTTRLRKAAGLLLATATAAAGLALPAAAAQAAAPIPCPKIIGVVCAQTAAGELRFFTADQPSIVPPVVRAVSQDHEPWCFYAEPDYNGERREVSPWELVEDFGFDVHSARRGQCTWS
ncbi:hypothetical protein [Nonomuraea sp. NPDC023979]|uniref:hypothetical protein n=1 Tax=Nonomuraea sp. NPDC023979 TaxID=3154796 RepID=UPI00340F2CAE